MALPDTRFNFQGGKKEVAEIVSGIGQAIFSQVRGSLEAASKTVVPSIQTMVAEITEDLSAGPIDRFNEGLEKVDRLVNKMGVDLGKYSKDLNKFLQERTERAKQSEETINQLRTQNIVAQVNKFGEVSILTQTEIEEQKKLLREQNVEIKDSQKIIEKYSKIQQKGGDLTAEQSAELVEANKKVIDTTEKRAKTLETLNITEADDTRSFRDKFDDTIETYVPDGLRDIGSAFTEGLTAPFTAIKELGLGFMSMLKPLKLLPKLLKGFTVGLLGALAAMIPYLLIAGAIVIGLIALKKGFDLVVDNLDVIKQKLSDFGDAVMAIPGKIADFFTGIFTKVKNFFIDAINGVIDLINKFKPGKDIEKLKKDPVPGEIDTTSGDQDAAFTAGNLSDTTSAIEQQDNAFLVPPTTGDEGGGFFSKFKNMFKSKPNNNEYLPVDTSAASSNAIIDNSVKTVNQNNQNQNLGISSRNDDVTIRLSDAAA
jgi:hypothetical protein